MDDEIKAVKGAVGVVAELMKAAGENPEVQEAGKNLGKAALTISKTINTALLPFVAVNFAVDRARDYFSGEFQKDLLDRTKDIPLEDIVEPKASIAQPAMAGLALTHEEQSLKAMYLSLLATAMDKRLEGAAHPAFAEIIRQLDGREVIFLEVVLRRSYYEPLAVLTAIEKTDSDGWVITGKRIANLMDRQTKRSIESKDFDAMLDNWVRLGLVALHPYEHQENQVTGTTPSIEVASPSDRFAWVKEHPDYLSLERNAQEGNSVFVEEFERAWFSRTALGVRFAKAVGLFDGDAPSTQAGGAAHDS